MFVLETLKKALKMTSQLVIFRAFFSSPDPKSESRKSTNTKILALTRISVSQGTLGYGLSKGGVLGQLELFECDKVLFL